MGYLKSVGPCQSGKGHGRVGSAGRQARQKHEAKIRNDSDDDNGDEILSYCKDCGKGLRWWEVDEPIRGLILEERQRIWDELDKKFPSNRHKYIMDKIKPIIFQPGEKRHRCQPAPSKKQKAREVIGE